MMVLVAGPYRGGTQDDPQLIAANLAALEIAALQLFEAGYLPVIGEWIALPLMRQAGSLAVGDEIYRKFAYPASHRLLDHCHAVLRLPGASAGADEDVRRARARGIPVYFNIDEISH